VHLNLSPIIGIIPHPWQETIRLIGFLSVLILFAEAFKITSFIIFLVSTISNFKPKAFALFLKHFSQKSMLGWFLHLYLFPIIGFILHPSQVANGWTSFFISGLALSFIVSALAFLLTIFLGYGDWGLGEVIPNFSCKFSIFLVFSFYSFSIYFVWSLTFFSNCFFSFCNFWIFSSNSFIFSISTFKISSFFFFSSSFLFRHSSKIFLFSSDSFLREL